MSQIYKPTQKLNAVLVFIFDVLAFAGGSGVILAFFHWLADVLPIFAQLGLFQLR